MPIAIEMFLAGVACGVELLALVKKSKCGKHCSWEAWHDAEPLFLKQNWREKFDVGRNYDHQKQSDLFR